MHARRRRKQRALRVAEALSDPASLTRIPDRRRDGYRDGRRTVNGLIPQEARWVELVTEGVEPEKAYAEAYSASRAETCRTGVWRLKRRPQVQAALLQAARAALQNGALAAANTLTSLAKSAKSEYVQADAAKSILDRVGLGAQQPGAGGVGGVAVQINIDLGGQKATATARLGHSSDPASSQAIDASADRSD